MTQNSFASQINLAGFPGLFAEGKGQHRESPIVFIHGAFGSHRDFENYLRFFSVEGFDCYAVSRRGRFGRLPENAQGVHFDDYLDDTLRVMETLDRSPILIGHSLGGLLAQKVAERGRCAAVVLLASAPPAPLTAQAQALPYYLSRLPAIVRGRPFRMSTEGYLHLALNRMANGERERIIEGLVPESGSVFWEMMTGAVRVDASQVRCPVLCVGGMEDRIISQGLARLTARKYNANLCMYPNHGHWLLAEPGWEAIAADVLAWLNENVAATHASQPAQMVR